MFAAKWREVMLSGVSKKPTFGFGDVRWVPAVREFGLVATKEHDGDLVARRAATEGVQDSDDGRPICVWHGCARWCAAQRVHVVLGGDGRV